MNRVAEIKRKTAETNIELKLNIDGTGANEISTGIGFLDHMIQQLSKHGFFDIYLFAQGDTHIDYHHTVEDVGIVLGQGFKEALGDRSGIKRFASLSCPLDEALAQVSLDLSGRPHLTYNVEVKSPKVGDFDSELFKEFWQAFANHAGITLHINKLSGENTHHIIEATFKGVAQGLDSATQIDPRIQGVRSSKGVL